MNGGQDEGASRARLLLCTPRFAPQLGGAETWTRELSRPGGARSRGCGGEPGWCRLAGPGPSRGDRRDTGAGRAGRVASRTIRARIRADRPAAVLAHYSALLPATLAAKRAGIPCIGIVHDVYGVGESMRIKGPVAGLARTFGLEQWLRLLPPDALLVPALRPGPGSQALVSRRPITVVQAGADHLAPVEPLRATQISCCRGAAGPAEGRGRHHRCARARERAGRPVPGPDHRGRPGAAVLEQRAQALGDGLRFAGSVSDAELDRAIGGSLALILPSRREGWGWRSPRPHRAGRPTSPTTSPPCASSTSCCREGLSSPGS